MVCSLPKLVTWVSPGEGRENQKGTSLVGVKRQIPYRLDSSYPIDWLSTDIALTHEHSKFTHTEMHMQGRTSMHKQTKAHYEHIVGFNSNGPMENVSCTQLCVKAKWIQVPSVLHSTWPELAAQVHDLHDIVLLGIYTIKVTLRVFLLSTQLFHP